MSLAVVLMILINLSFWYGRREPKTMVFGSWMLTGTTTLTFVSDCTSANFDNIVPPLLPLFECSSFHLPFRVLDAQEVSKLCGLEDCWQKTSDQDAKKLTDATIRNICGNSFHPALISSALGSNEVLQKWVNNQIEGPEGFVADPQKVFSIYAELVDVIKKVGSEKHKRFQLPIVEQMPIFPAVEAVTSTLSLPTIEQPILPTIRKVEVSKQDQRRDFGIDATVDLLNEDACWALEQAELSAYFDSLRAPVSLLYEPDNLIKILRGDTQAAKAVQTFNDNRPQLPVVEDIQRIRDQIGGWYAAPSHVLFVRSLLSTVTATKRSFWPVGYLVLIGTARACTVYYLGNSQPKLLLLCDYRDGLYRLTAPFITVLGATADNEHLLTGTAPEILPRASSVKTYNSEEYFFVEIQGEEWALHCQNFIATQKACPCCFLEKLKEIRQCPWHGQNIEAAECANTVAHVIGIDCGMGRINVLGYVAPLPVVTHLVFVHIITELQLANLQLVFCSLETPFTYFYQIPRSNALPDVSEKLSAPFFSDKVPRWLFQHFLVRAAGPKESLDAWLRPRCLL